MINTKLNLTKRFEKVIENKNESKKISLI